MSHEYLMAIEPITATALIVTGLFKAGAALFGASQQKKAANDQADYQKKITKINLMLSDRAYDDTLKRGDVEAGNLLKDARRLVGTQKASLAAQGIEIDSGSAADIQADTNLLSQQDATRLKINAMREAYGFKVEGIKASMESQLAEKAAKNVAKSSLIAGGLNAVGSLAESYTTYRSITVPRIKDK